MISSKVVQDKQPDLAHRPQSCQACQLRSSNRSKKKDIVRDQSSLGATGFGLPLKGRVNVQDTVKGDKGDQLGPSGIWVRRELG